ncbi:hypothetical protein P8C59_006622 [Phyllachora maydis]|uniref:Uncharacterized protein n=1 Tax=Phyllachora maydis TaxID=1825666 RepID=A0AAD9MEQ5_9PEZI|nr:hypothetical protein P8C59_006622 [Phyllachora maydis]
MPRGYDHDIRKQVDMNVEQGDGSYPKGRCLHCDKIIAVTASTIKRHLKGCHLYAKHRAEHPELHPESTELTPRRSINKALSSATTPTAGVATGVPAGIALGASPGLPKAPTAKSTALVHHASSAAAAAALSLATDGGVLRAAHLQAAKAVYVAGQSFRLYADPEQRELLRLLNPAYRPPSEDELAGELLDAVHDDYMARVRQTIDHLPWLNINLEAVENAGDEMVVNVCVNPAPGISFYWTRLNTGDIEITASNRLRLLRPVLADVTGGNPNRIMSYTMSTQRILPEANFVYCPIRNRLSADRMQKLLFIYYNHRILKLKQKSWPQLTETEIEEAENLLFQS